MQVRMRMALDMVALKRRPNMDDTSAALGGGELAMHHPVMTNLPPRRRGSGSDLLVPRPFVEEEPPRVLASC